MFDKAPRRWGLLNGSMGGELRGAAPPRPPSSFAWIRKDLQNGRGSGKSCVRRECATRYGDARAREKFRAALAMALRSGAANLPAPTPDKKPPAMGRLVENKKARFHIVSTGLPGAHRSKNCRYFVRGGGDWQCSKIHRTLRAVKLNTASSRRLSAQSVPRRCRRVPPPSPNRTASVASHRFAPLAFPQFFLRIGLYFRQIAVFK